MNYTHWKQYQDDNTLGAWIFEPNKDIIVTIKKIEYEDFTGTDGKKKKGRICYFEEYDKPLVLNATNSATISLIYSTPYMEEWIGKQVQLYKTTIRAFGEDKECVRIRKLVPCECAECKKQIQGFQKMNEKQMSLYTQKNYGKPLCAECAQKKAGSK